MAAQQISRRNTEAAVRAVIDRYLAEGVMAPDGVAAIGSAAIPLAAKSCKELQMRGYTGAEITAYLAEKVEHATYPARRLAAELYAAAWEGMQADFREAFGRELAP